MHFPYSQLKEEDYCQTDRDEMEPQSKVSLIIINSLSRISLIRLLFNNNLHIETPLTIVHWLHWNKNSFCKHGCKNEIRSSQGVNQQAMQS